ncbi:Hypothetical protein I5071_150 (plasmid) [Sandaracinus amylolyticus]|uniref:hypothetical protein n=1 Tax=Sandaracinus sp. TaxID=2024858 RepID=UPI0019D47A95|nr:hypothetical protein [Sandaracinus sp.]QRN75739.1 Hypothetical protein MSR10575_88260 [Sandaracinus sp.]UJR87224.1 Hypothetical protein I5071_150 [Sandaracinus amylolyticus]
MAHRISIGFLLVACVACTRPTLPADSGGSIDASIGSDGGRLVDAQADAQEPESDGGRHDAASMVHDAGPSCVSEADCRSTHACLRGLCTGGTCSYVPQDAGTECRAAAGVCDIAELCDGTGSDCPDDVLVGVGRSCTDDLNPCTNDVCDGAGACSHPPRPAGDPCPADSNECTLDRCDGAGACAHPAVADDTLCDGDFGICCGGACVSMVSRTNCGSCGNSCSGRCCEDAVPYCVTTGASCL